MITDDRPMQSMHENGMALYRTYGNLEVAPGSAFAPWQVALLDWWQFVGRREGIVLLRRLRSGEAGGATSPTDTDPSESPSSLHPR
jgi:hypothetical protein